MRKYTCEQIINIFYEEGLGGGSMAYLQSNDLIQWDDELDTEQFLSKKGNVFYFTNYFNAGDKTNNFLITDMRNYEEKY